MKNNKGFTLVEILAVVIIIGLVMTIAIPAVSRYMLDSRRTSYVANMNAYAETIKGEFMEKEFGDFPEDGDILIVPIEYIALEKSEGKKSPFGEYDYDRSYVVIVPERNTYQYYISVRDDSGKGMVSIAKNKLNKEEVIDVEIYDIPALSNIVSNLSILSVAGGDYEHCGERSYKDDPNKSILLMCSIK